MDQRKLAALASQVSELSEQVAVLKAQLIDERWDNVAKSLEVVNQNFAVVNDRIARLEAWTQKTTEK